MTSRTAQRRRALERWRAPDVVAVPSGSALVALIPRAPGSNEPEHERAVRLARDAERARVLAANWRDGDRAHVGLGLVAWRDVARVQVPPSLRRDLVLGAGRPTECYQVALTYLLDHSEHDVVLVHGLLTECGRLWSHAWAEVDGAVFDPQVADFLDRRDYYAKLKARVVATFTAEQAAFLTIVWGSAGPWPVADKDRHDQMVTEAVASLVDSYTQACPELLAWVRAMRERDARFADDLAALEGDDLVAVADLLATLAEHPERWRDHQPGTCWPYRLAKRWGTKQVIFPKENAHG